MVLMQIIYSLVLLLFAISGTTKLLTEKVNYGHTPLQAFLFELFFVLS